MVNYLASIMSKSLIALWIRGTDMGISCEHGTEFFPGPRLAINNIMISCFCAPPCIPRGQENWPGRTGLVHRYSASSGHCTVEENRLFLSISHQYFWWYCRSFDLIFVHADIFLSYLQTDLLSKTKLYLKTGTNKFRLCKVVKKSREYLFTMFFLICLIIYYKIGPLMIIIFTGFNFFF